MRANTLFNQPLPGFIADVKAGIQEIDEADQAAAAHLKARTTALEILMAYPFKDADGRPLPHPVGTDDHLHTTVYEITADEARALGLQGTSASMHQLVGVQDERVPAIGMAVAKIITSRQPSLSLSNAVLTQRQQAYAVASAALTTVGTPEPFNRVGLPVNRAKAEAWLTALEELAAQGQTHVWVTSAEQMSVYAALFASIDVEHFSKDEQATRANLKACMEHAQANKGMVADQRKHPFEVYYDPTEVLALEKVMKDDPTALWLLRFAKGHNVPVITASYLTDTNETRAAGGLVRPDGKTGYYILNFTNGATPTYRAHVNAHEIRHLWQELLVSPEQRAAMNPADYLLVEFLCEADAQSVGNKVIWNLDMKGHRLGKSAGHERAEEFRKHYIATDPNLSRPTRLKKAMQETFIQFLEAYLENPYYLKQYVTSLVKQGRDPGVWTRQLSESPLLQNDFLKRLSKVSQRAHYLDEEGIARVRELLTTRLPGVIQKLQQQAVLENLQLHR